MATLHANVWEETAVAPAAYPPLTESRRADVVVVGAGYLGLATALHLAQAGIHVIVVDAQEPGSGASGRNGGQVIPGFKYDPDELELMFGRERGERIWRFGAGTADVVFDLIARHRMRVPTRRAGWVQGIHSHKAVDKARRRAEQWQRRGVDVSYLDAATTAAIAGTELYLGGIIDRRGGAIQPLSFARELAKVTCEAGANIYAKTAVSRFDRMSDGWRLTCATGAVITARAAILATNAYSKQLVPGLDMSIVAANSLQVATEPLPEELRAYILPNGEVLSDTRKVIRYWRLDGEGRLLMGGRGPYREPNAESDWAHLIADIRALFPDLVKLRLTHRWGGRVAINLNFLPRLHEPSPGLLIAIGCQGRGVGLQTALGPELARRVLDSSYDMPFPITAIEPIPFHALKAVGASAMVGWYRFADRVGLS